MLHKHLKGAIDRGYCEALLQELDSSPHVGNSPLGPEFVNTLGFSMVFRRAAAEDVFSEFPYLRLFYESVTFPTSNAFFINPVIMRAGSRVGAHIDCRLLPKENVRLIPNLVSILYVLSKPEGKGGELLLHYGDDTQVAVKPETGDVLHFAGKLLHSVTALEDTSRRVSLVCEQYNLTDELLEKFPEFDLIKDKDVAPRATSK